MKHRAVFVDKDGTLIPDIPYNVDAARITLAPGAGEALRRLQHEGYRIVVISNQSGVARGLFEESQLEPVRQRLTELLASEGVSLDGFYYCPHHPDAVVARYAVDCQCRKPRPGMLLEASRALDIDLSRSWMVGDIAADSEAGKRAGCRTVLIEKPYDPVKACEITVKPDAVVTTWAAACQFILGANQRLWQAATEDNRA